MRRSVYAALLVLLGGSIGALAVAGIWLQSERSKYSKSEDTIGVDIVSAESVARIPYDERKIRETLLSQSRAAGSFHVTESPAQFVVQPSQIYDVRFPPGEQIFVKADSGKALLFVDDMTAVCVETYARARPQRKLRVSTCDNKEARLTATAKAEAAKQ